MSLTLKRGALRRKEFLLIAIPSIVALISAAALSFGLNPKLIWIPCLVLFVWPVYLLTEKFQAEEVELSFLQSRRATAYFLGLLVMIPVNAILITPRNPITILLTPIAAGILIQVTNLVVRSSRKEMGLFDKDEKELFKRVLGEAGVAVIWISCAIGFEEFLLATASISYLLLYGVPASILMGYIAYRNEARSVRFSIELANHLKTSRWARRAKFMKKR